LRQLEDTLRKHFAGVSRLQWIGESIASGRQRFPRILECGSQEVSCLGSEGGFRFAVSATCRASFGLYNTREEVDGLAQALIKAQGFFA
jgi:selenocysteine lyase/cysteine desulfurase